MGLLTLSLLFTLATAPDLSTAAKLEQSAGVHTDAGDYTSAFRDATRAAAIYAAHGDQRGRGRALNRAGLALLYSGDYGAAARELQRAIDLSSSAHDTPAAAEALTNLGNVNYFIGRYSGATANYTAALQMTAAHAGEPWTLRRRRIILINQATLDQKLGRDEQALTTYRQVQAEGADLRPREQAQLLMNLGVLYRHLGDPIKALAVYDEAQRLFAREQHLDGELGVMKNRGIVLALDLNRLPDARAIFSEALDRATKAENRREMLQARLYRGETELRMGVNDPAIADFTTSLSDARELKTPEEQWKALYGLARAEMRRGNRPAATEDLSQAIAIIEMIRESLKVPSLKSDFFNDKRDVYDALIGIELDQATPERIFELVEQSHSRAWRDRLGLAGRITLQRVQRGLPPRALLLDTWSSPGGSAILSVTRDHVDVRHVAVSPAAIQALIDALSAGPSPEWQSSAAAIAAQVLPPALPADVDHVMVVPDGTLTLVPFELLPANGRLLIERAAVSYLPTAAMLFRATGETREFAAPWRDELRAFADPQDSPRLPASADEVRSIAAELGGRSSLHLGSDDKKSYLYDANASAPILHIASHAVADADAIEQSRILFSGDDLFVREAYALPLKNVDLAVLSACDTERGRYLRGEGVQSFSRAFLAAGARSTVTTLWRVPDGPTAAFMKLFYHHLQRGVPRAEALRRAKMRFLQSGSGLNNPHYWAAFILTGEGALPVPTATRWSSILIGCLVVLIVALAIFLFR